MIAAALGWLLNLGFAGSPVATVIDEQEGIEFVAKGRMHYTAPKG